MLNNVTEVNQVVNQDECIGCEYGEHVEIQFFTDYASPSDIARLMGGYIDADVDLLEYKFADLNTQHFVDFLRTIPEDKQMQISYSEYFELAKAYNVN